MWILVVEDEPAMRQVVCRGLEEANHTVAAAADGAEALAALETSAFDAVLLDMMLPGIGGLDVLRRVRARGNQVPILILTALDTPSDVVAGLDAGADDYLAKPFAFEVLLARLRTMARRALPRPLTSLRAGDLVMTLETRTVERGGSIVPLTPTEFRLLEFLLRRAGRAVSRDAIIEGVWGLGADVELNTVDVFVKLLRAKVDTTGRRLIQSIRGYGYILRDEP